MTIRLSTLFFTLVNICTFGSISFAQESIAAPTFQLSSVDQADELIQDVFKKENFPGLAIEVWKNGVSVFSKGYGYADIASARPIVPESSQFRIGSVSKPFTSAALAKLYEQGKVNLDAPIQTYVSNFPKKEHDISLRQLAGHLGGIRHYKGGEFMSNIHYPSVQDGLSIFMDDKLINKPGTKYSYSSYGWNLISVAIENISGTKFLNFMNDDIFRPTEMTNTIADDNTRVIPNKVSFYTKKGDHENHIAQTVDNSYKWAGGGFLSTVQDMAKFGQAHIEASILKEETIALWIESQYNSAGEKTNYGIGWRSGADKKGRQWFGHSGGSVGGSSMLIIYPKENLVVAMAINLSGAKYRNLPFRVAEQFLREQN